MNINIDTSQELGNVESILTDETKRKKVVSNSFIHRLQRKHFILFQILPFLLTLVFLPLIPYLPFGKFEIFLFVLFWLITGFGVSSGYHRLFTHRSYKTHDAVQVILAICGAMAGQGGVISWSALHRRHHELSDKLGDPHSPNLQGSSWLGRLRGLVHSHVTWMYKHEYPSVVHYVPDLIKNKTLLKVDRYYYLWAALGFVLPTLLGGLYHWSLAGALAGFIWGGVLRILWGGHTIWSINSFLHCFGMKRFQTEEYSHNFALIALFTFGESWHNNHHAFPASASFGLEWYRLDPGYWFIQLLEVFHLAWDVKVPTTEKIQSRELNA
ncbi:acyl-CoA desaturase [Aphanizomenon flos-aquae]|jgi:stearoyl-CoA desaturase (delta-9 desaturase)|uniref:Fatty acid desaturase n=1 Tax=Aphanizomenon flos-aquae FACHB-1040 TaxID=2692887 RepID=A0ABR8BY35_APHFL|nr:fatty acid desaturase [Aphanizomenon flos-aquae]MBD2279360.1 fatty acid desaturase [Aphanizomenon flos-aquae FACHB-1040]